MNPDSIARRPGPAAAMCALMVSMNLLSGTVQADRGPGRLAPADILEPDLVTQTASCDPAVATEGRWASLNDNFAWRGQSLVFNSSADQLVVFGGADVYNRGILPRGPVTNQTWIRPSDLSAPWQLLATSTPLPMARQFHTAIYDPVRNRMIMFGGFSNLRGRGDLWQLDFTTSPPQWSELHPTGSLPPARYNHAAIYDPERRRMLIFGGMAGDWGRPAYDYANDFWELSLDGPPAWRRIFTLGTTLPRVEGARGTYDSGRDRWILSGGEGRMFSDPAGFMSNRVYGIDLATMEATLLPALPHGPPSLAEHSITYDQHQDRVLVFGGAEAFAEGALALSLADPGSGWRTLASVTPSPESRVEHVEWFDARRNRLLIIGGGHTNNPIPGTNILSFGRRMRTALDPASRVPFNPRSHRPVTVVLYGSDPLAASELAPTSIRVGEAPVIEGVHGALAFTTRDADGDGFVDAIVEVESHAIALESGSQSVNVNALTHIGDSVCGVLELDPVATPGRLLEDPNLDATGGAPLNASSGIEFSAIPGAAARNGIQFRVRIPSGDRFALELWSVRGRLIASTRLKGPLDQVVALHPGSSLAPGIYWARISGTSKSPALRVVIVE